VNLHRLRNVADVDRRESCAEERLRKNPPITAPTMINSMGDDDVTGVITGMIPETQ
jgi:hypothetical protein